MENDDETIDEGRVVGDDDDEENGKQGIKCFIHNKLQKGRKMRKGQWQMAFPTTGIQSTNRPRA